MIYLLTYVKHDETAPTLLHDGQPNIEHLLESKNDTCTELQIIGEAMSDGKI